MTTLETHRLQDAALVAPPILVVDDSRAQRRLLAKTLQKWGYETIEAESGEAALNICTSRAIDIVISDWMMPGMSGVEFCLTLRNQVSGRPAYFILLTAQTEREVLAEGLESGADDFLSKPCNSVELRARLRAGERIVNAQKDLTRKNRALSDTLSELSDAYAAIERDLRGARKFQESLVPDKNIHVGEYDVSMLYRPSGHVGGDLVGHFRVNDHETGVYSVDVSGHGVASALMTARVAGYLSDAVPERNIALRPSSVGGFETVPLCDVLVRLNDLLHADASTDQYLTMAIAVIDTRSGRVRMCQAGHPSPVLQRGNGGIKFLEMFSTPIGLLDEGDFACTEIQLEKGDRLLLYSDGLTECPDPKGELLDEDGLEDILKRYAQSHGSELVEAIIDELTQYQRAPDFPDDLSAVIVERS